jgi:NTP pyrophosphatase (non-canonical NTP hydrolase)
MLKSDLIPVICQEECAEVVQAISKVFRFGPNQTYKGQTNKQRLEEELGQLLFAIEQLQDAWALDPDEMAAAYHNKRESHSQWYDYFPKDTNENTN